MASPIVAEVETMWKAWTKLFDYELVFAGTAAASLNWVELEDAFVQGLKTDYPAEIADALRGARANLDASLQTYPAGLLPIMVQYAKAMGTTPETDLFTIIQRRIYDYFVANTKTIKSRGISFGSPSAAGGNTGTGTINRLNKDKNNFNIESVFLETITALCVQDQNSGTRRHEEVLEFRGAAKSRDGLLPSGSGLVRNIACISAAQSLLINPSFSDYAGTAAVPTDIPGWTALSSIGNFLIDQTNYYREIPGESTPGALKIKANDTVYQRISLQNLAFDSFTPYYLQIAWNREVYTGDGTITLHLGSKTVAVVAGAQTGWQILRIALGTDNWYDNFKEDQLDIKIVLSGRTTGSILVDDVILAPFVNFDNKWFAPVGSATPFLRGDSFSIADALSGSDSKLQKWLWRANGTYLPHDPAPSISDP